jgi:hypothetical protein
METCKPCINIPLEPGRESPTAENSVVSAGFQKPREGSVLAAKHFRIRLLPKMPAAKKKEGGGGVARNPVWGLEER